MGAAEDVHEGHQLLMAHIETRERTKGRRTYIVRWREPGTQAKQHKTFHRFDDARSFKIDVESKIDRGEYVSRDRRQILFGDYAQEVLAGDLRLRDSTRYNYEKCLSKWILPEFGASSLGDLSTGSLRAFLASLPVNSSVPATVYRLLAKVLNQAVTDGILIKSPLKAISRPSAQRREIKPLDPAIIRLIADHADPRYRLPILLGGFTGLRAGEIGGLHLTEVDFHEGTIRITKAVRQAGPKRILGDVKTPSSRRLIKLPAFLVGELKQYLQEYPPVDGRIFSTEAGGYVSHTVLLKRLHSACRAAGQPLIRFHDLRHTCAALLIRQGAHPKMIQAYLGHANISITLDLYGHLFPSLAEELADRLDEAWGETAKVVGLKCR